MPSDAGLSAETLLFEAFYVDDGTERRHSLVARIRPRGESVFPTYDLESEFGTLAALGPVPPVLWHERDASVLGGEFIVMERIEGRVPPDDPPYTVAGWVLDLEPREQTALMR